MAIKKKTTKEETEKKISTQAPMVTQVVEVIEEEIASPAQSVEDAIAQAAKVSEEEISAVAAPPEENLSEVLAEESGAVLEDHLNISKEEEQKETVAELFKKSQTPIMPEIAMHTKDTSKKSLFLWALVLILIAGLIGGGLMMAKKKSFSLPKLTIIPSPSPTPTPTPTPTPMPPNRGDITIQILNGGGVSGAASKMKKLLEDKGYKVGDVSNADAYTYDKTELHVKTAKSAYQKLLIDDLKDTYSISTNTAALTDSVSYDGRVIVGTQ